MPTNRYVTGLPLWLALGTIYLVWGSTYLGIAVAIESLPPFVMLAVRFAVAGVLLIGWDVLRHRGRIAWPSRRELRDTAIVGALLLGIGNGFVGFAEQTVASGIAAIIVAMVPLWLAVFGRLYFGESLPRVAVVGVAVGLAGVAILVWPAGAGANAFDPLGIAVLLVSPVAWAHGSLFSAHRARLPRSALTAAGLQMLAGAAVLVVEALLTGELSRVHAEAVSLRSVAALAYLVVIGSMVGYSAYFWLLRHAPLSLVGTYAYVNPIVAVALGAALLAEPISPRTLVASAVIVAAVAMIVTARGRMSGGRNTVQPRREELAPGGLDEPATPAIARGAGSLTATLRRLSAAVTPRAPSG
jgi:drug/metabolite transporter (DMT)-like permease